MNIIKVFFLLVLISIESIVVAQEITNDYLLGEWELVRIDSENKLKVKNKKARFLNIDTLYNSIVYDFISKKKLSITRKDYNSYGIRDTIVQENTYKWRLGRFGNLKVIKKAYEGKNIWLKMILIDEDRFYFSERNNVVTGERESKRYIFQRVGRKPSLEDSLNGVWVANLGTESILNLDTMVLYRPDYLKVLTKEDTVQGIAYSGHFFTEELDIKFDVFQEYSEWILRKVEGYADFKYIGVDGLCQDYEWENSASKSYGFKIRQSIALENGILKIRTGTKRMPLKDVYTAVYSKYEILLLTKERLVLKKVE